MLGVVFTEFLDFLDAHYGSDLVDDVIDAACVPNDGAYTAVGCYHHTEFQGLAFNGAQLTGHNLGDLLRRFGAALCERFVASFPHTVNRYHSVSEFLCDFDTIRMRDLRWLNPDHGFPALSIDQPDHGGLRLALLGNPALHPLVEGALLALADVFDETMTLTREPIASDGRQGTCFLLQTTAEELAA